MAQLKISYFDVNGGRAEPIRLALHNGGIAFEDYRFPYSDFEEERKSTPLGQVPILTIDNVQITQSNAILRYVGKQSGLYATDLYQALLCDEVIDLGEDCTTKIVATFALQGPALKTARETLIEGPLSKYLKYLDAKLVAQGGEFFADNQLTIADLKVMTIINWLNANALDHIPHDLVASIAPKLSAYHQKILVNEAIFGYYASL
jgi:glutathione S-transferase